MTDKAERLIAEAIDNPNAPKSEQRLVREWEEWRAQWDGPRWALPMRPILIENASEGMVTFDGNVYRQPFNATFHPYDIGRLREGYGCLRCWSVFESPNPDVCTLPGCGYPIASRQAEDLAKEFEGEKWVGPTTSLADEFERMLDNGQRNRHVPGSQIILPRGVTL